VRTKTTYLASQYARIKGRRAHKKAIGAVAHSILTIAYHVLQRGRPLRGTWGPTTCCSATTPPPTPNAWSGSSNASVTRSPWNPDQRVTSFSAQWWHVGMPRLHARPAATPARCVLGDVACGTRCVIQDLTGQRPPPIS
jgi:hypothetical protein